MAGLGAVSERYVSLPGGLAYLIERVYHDPWGRRAVAGTLLDLRAGTVQPGALAIGPSYASAGEILTAVAEIHLAEVDR